MSAFVGRWFNLPRKRSNSTPTRQVLAEYLNRSSIDSFLPPQNQQYSYHNMPASAGYSSLPINTTHPTNTLKAAHSTPLLITASFYDLAYPFEPCDSPEEETPPQAENSSRPPTPSSTTDVKPQQNHELNSNNQNKQQQMGTQASLSPQVLPNRTQSKVQYQQEVHQDVYTDYYSHNVRPITWHIETSPRKIPSNKGGYPTIKRRPTPFADQKSGYHSYDEEENEIAYHHGGIENTSAMDDLMISHTSGKTFNTDVYNAEIKRLEIKHKHERDMLDTQQRMEYLLISRSYESTFFHNGSATRHYSYNINEPPNSDHHHQPPQPQSNYWYAPYDSDYYYNNRTPNNSYSNKNSSHNGRSKDHHDYYSLPNSASETAKNSNNKAASSSTRYDLSDSNNPYLYGCKPSSYASNSAIGDEDYYYQLQQHQLLYRHHYVQGFNVPSKKEDKKRWTQ